MLINICNKLVWVPWLMLLLLPRWEWTEKLVFYVWVPFLLGGAYIFAFYHAYPFPENSGFGSLAEIQTAFTSPWLVAAGWIHYLVFDLFVGAWEVRDAARRGIHHLWVVPCLIITLLAGPAGLLLYLLIRAALTKILTLVETEGI